MSSQIVARSPQTQDKEARDPWGLLSLSYDRPSSTALSRMATLILGNLGKGTSEAGKTGKITATTQRCRTRRPWIVQENDAATGEQLFGEDH